MDSNYIGEFIVIKNQKLIKVNRPKYEKPFTYVSDKILNTLKGEKSNG